MIKSCFQDHFEVLLHMQWKHIQDVIWCMPLTRLNYGKMVFVLWLYYLL